MIKYLAIFAFCFGINFAAEAQVMNKKPQLLVVQSANLRCWICQDRLEKYLTRQNSGYLDNGIIEWKIDLKRGSIKLKYYPDRVSPEEIRITINNAGFDADQEKATEDSYKKLPASCKRAEDGGGPTKDKPCDLPPDE